MAVTLSTGIAVSQHICGVGNQAAGTGCCSVWFRKRPGMRWRVMPVVLTPMDCMCRILANCNHIVIRPVWLLRFVWWKRWSALRCGGSCDG